MEESRALVSGWTAATDEDLRSDHLKLCFLWYDKIIVEPIGKFDEVAFIRGLLGAETGDRSVLHAMSDVIVPLDQKLKEEVTGGLIEQGSRGYPRWGDQWENYHYPEPETPEEFAHNSLLDLIAEELGVKQFEDGYDIQQAEGRARVAVDAVKLWEGVNAEIPCMLQASPDERAAMEAARSFGSPSVITDTSLTLLELALPSLRDVPWSEVVRFSQNRSIRSLRQNISRCAEESGSDIDKARQSFCNLEAEVIDSIIDGSRPRTKRVAFEAVLANIPGLPVNPFSLFLGARDTKHEHQRQRESGWFYLLRDIRRGTGAANRRVGA